MDKKLEDLSVVEVKALAYDTLVQIESLQGQLKILSERVYQLQQPKEVTPPQEK